MVLRPSCTHALYLERVRCTPPAPAVAKVIFVRDVRLQSSQPFGEMYTFLSDMTAPLST